MVMMMGHNYCGEVDYFDVVDNKLIMMRMMMMMMMITILLIR